MVADQGLEDCTSVGLEVGGAASEGRRPVEGDEGVAGRGGQAVAAVSDPFAEVRRLSDLRTVHADRLRDEVRSLRAAGYSLRAIAQAANVSPDTAMRWSR